MKNWMFVSLIIQYIAHLIIAIVQNHVNELICDYFTKKKEDNKDFFIDSMDQGLIVISSLSEIQTEQNRQTNVFCVNKSAQNLLLEAISVNGLDENGPE